MVGGRRSVLALALQLVLGCAAAAANTSAFELASVQYPGYIPVVLQPTTTNNINKAVHQVISHQSSYDAPSTTPAVVVILGSGSSSQALVVDDPVTVSDSVSLAITTPAALAAAASAQAGTAIGPSVADKDLLLVHCKSSQVDGFLNASDAGDVAVSGLALQRCPGLAIQVVTSRSLSITDCELKENNRVVHRENGGAVLAVGLQQVTFTRVSCHGNYATTNGGCLYATYLGQGLTISLSLFEYNWKKEKKTDDPMAMAYNGGGGAGVYTEAAGTVTVSHCKFAHNAALGKGSNGGGISAQIAARVLVDHCMFMNNSAALEGGGLAAWDVGELLVRDTNFTHNGLMPLSADDPPEAKPYPMPAGAGAAVQGSRPWVTTDNAINATFERVRFMHNHAVTGGGLTCTQWGMDEGWLEVADCLFHDNQGYKEAGGLFYNWNFFSKVAVRRSTFSNNFGEVGGAASVYDSDVLVEDSVYINNSATADGGAWQLQTIKGLGSGNRLYIKHSRFYNNSTPTLGGAVAVDGQALIIENSTFIANHAGERGGAVSVMSASDVVVSGGSFQNNTCRQSGAALAILEVGVLTVESATFTRNVAMSGGAVALDQVTATLNNTTLHMNKAGFAGGGIVMFRAGNVSIANSRIAGNRALVGGGLAAVDSVMMSIQTMLLPDLEDYLGTVGSRAKDNVAQSVEALWNTVMKNPSRLCASGTAGTAPSQLLILSLINCTVWENLAGCNAGGMLLQQPAQVSASESRFQGNRALNGDGGAWVLRGTGNPIATKIRSCTFDQNTAEHGSGGAVALDYSLGAPSLECKQCLFESNRAWQDGGAVAARGRSVFGCSDCEAKNNVAGRNGGWFFCTGCDSAVITGGGSTNNTAGQACGATGCDGCATVEIRRHRYFHHTAGSGGAVAVQAAYQAQVTDCQFDNNKCASRDGATAGGAMETSDELPPDWQALFEATAVKQQAPTCSDPGSGGSLCMEVNHKAQLANVSMTNSTGHFGGGLFVSAAAIGSAGSKVLLQGLSITGASALAAGGAFYTTSPEALDTTSVTGSCVEACGDLNSQAVVGFQEQLSSANSVAAGGYGPGAASLPAALSLMDSKTLSSATVTQQQLSDSPQPRTKAKQQKKQAAKTKQQGDAFDIVCPALGATVLGPTHVEVDSSQVFSLPVFILDAFGAKISNGPGSGWFVTLTSNKADVQISGAVRGRLSKGSVTLEGLRLSAPLYSNFTMSLLAIGRLGTVLQPMTTMLSVSVRPCLPGQRAEYPNGTVASTPSSKDNGHVICSTCPAPSFSFSAYSANHNHSAKPYKSTPAGADVCSVCPARGICAAGMIIPGQGCYHPHPRSATIHACPHIKACLRDSNTVLNLQGLQCSYRAYLAPDKIDANVYSALQCSKGYTGPFCSVCYRQGRNPWIAAQLQHQQVAQSNPSPGYTYSAQPHTLVKPRSNIDPQETYGRRNGRCSKCPHPALAYLGFLLARVFDMVIIALLSVLWLALGLLSNSPASEALQALKASLSTKKGLGVRDCVLGSGLFNSISSKWKQQLSTSDSFSKHPGPASQLRATKSAAKCQSGSSPGSDRQLSCTGSSSRGLSAAYAPPSRLLSSGILSRTLSVYYRLSSTVSLRRSGVASRDQQETEQDVLTLEAQASALLLGVLEHMTCLVQVVLDTAQIGAALLSLDLVYFLPDWAATGLSAVLITQANTWQWMSFDCLVPGQHTVSPAVVETVVVLLLPVIYTAVLIPVLSHLRHLTEQYSPSNISQHRQEQQQSEACLTSKDTQLDGQYGPDRFAVMRDIEHCSTIQAQKDNDAVPNPNEPKLWSWFKSWVSGQDRSFPWALATSTTLASMAYCFALYAKTVVSAFNCMALAQPPTLPGEVHLKGSHWVPDMQQQCWVGNHIAVVVLAVLVGVPLVLGYLFLLLALAWPPVESLTECESEADSQSATPTPAAAAIVIPEDADNSCRCVPSPNQQPCACCYWIIAAAKLLAQLPGQLLESAVCWCQQNWLQPLSITGETCAAAGVWNAHRWYWLPVREVVKLLLVTAAVTTSMRSPQVQALVLMLLVMLAAAVSWQVQAGCSTSMNRMQFAAGCWLQLLVVLVLIMMVPGVNADVYGSVVLGLVAIVMLQWWIVLSCLAWRGCKCIRYLQADQ